MSTTAWLRHISEKGLQRALDNIEIYTEVISDLSPANGDAPKFSSLSELSDTQVSVLKEITDEVSSVLNHWSTYDIELVEDLKHESPKFYAYLMNDLYSIIMDENKCSHLDLGLAWGLISSLFRDAMAMDSSTSIIDRHSSPAINIFSGLLVDPQDDEPFYTQRYQGADKVREIAQSFSKIDNYEIQRRFESSLREQPRTYKYSWTEESYPFLLDGCREVKKFYQAAAENNFCIINAIG